MRNTNVVLAMTSVFGSTFESLIHEVLPRFSSFVVAQTFLARSFAQQNRKTHEPMRKLARPHGSIGHDLPFARCLRKLSSVQITGSVQFSRLPRKILNGA